MGRVRSRAHPIIPLSEVIELARKIHEKDRQHPVSREVAAQHMGFSGLSGSSDRAISALQHFGLAEKVAKGELRVTDLALDLLHPHSAHERRIALRRAAFNPDLFQELRERYPGDPPSTSTLASYLSRLNFAPAAIGPAAKAYLETCYYLQREGAYESEPGEDHAEAELASANREEPTAMHTPQNMVTTASSAVPVTATPTVQNFQPAHELALNEIALNVRGGLVHVEARLDYDGLLELEQKLTALKMLMQPSKKAPPKTEQASSVEGDDARIEGNLFS